MVNGVKISRVGETVPDKSQMMKKRLPLKIYLVPLMNKYDVETTFWRFKTKSPRKEWLNFEYRVLTSGH